MDFNLYKDQFTEKALNQGYSAENIQRCLDYAKPLLKEGLPIIYNTTHLCALVGYNKKFIKRASIYTSYFYRSFQIKKSIGGTRTIEEPLPSLKEIQHWILKNILDNIQISAFAKAYKKRTSLKENVRFHLNKENILKLDIKNFFPSIHLRDIEAIFKNLGYSDLLSNLLAKLCTKNKVLPQGAPTSPYLSNLFFKPVDDEISSYCVSNNIKYTRYADDLTFSGSFDKEALENFITEKIRAIGLEVNSTKTKFLNKSSRQIVTGIVVNEKLQVPFKTRNKIRQEIYYIKEHGPKDHKRFKGIKQSNYISHLLGKVNFILNFNPKDKEFIEYKIFLIQLRKEHPHE